MAGRTRGRKGRREALESFGKREGNGLQGRYCFLRFFRPPILIGQILRITQSVVLIGQRPVMQEHRSLHIHSFNMADISSDRLEHLLGETLRSLEENGMKFVIKAEQKKAIRVIEIKKL